MDARDEEANLGWVRALYREVFADKGNYPRLQRVKARWDPSDVFHHALSIRLP